MIFDATLCFDFAFASRSLCEIASIPLYQVQE
jgi:hypothetical protein